MCEIKEYKFSLDSNALEIFPTELTENPYVVYHGTCTHHSNNIETNGLVIHTPPYNLEWAKKLCDTLEAPEFSTYDPKKGFFNWTTAFSMRHYIDAIVKKDFKISFSVLSGECLLFTNGASKGGQAMGDIREAKAIIERAIATTPSLIDLIPQEVKDLFGQLDAIDKSSGLIYAIKLPEDLASIVNENEIIYSNISIPASNIIGKIFVDPTYSIPFTRQEATAKRREKLLSPKGLGRLIHQSIPDENADEG